jgi:hypothetical protein
VNPNVCSAIAIALLTTIPAGVVSAQDYGRRDTDFEIEVERRTEFPPGYDAHLNSTTIYPCTGYDIRAGFSWMRDTLTIDIGGFRRPSPCIALPASATGSLYVGDIGFGSYVLRIRYRGDEDLHRMTVTDKGVRFRSIRDDFTRLRGN